MHPENNSPEPIAPSDLKEVVGGVVSAKIKDSDCCIERSLYAPSTSPSS